MSGIIYSGSMDSYFRHCADENARERELYRLQREDEALMREQHIRCSGCGYSLYHCRVRRPRRLTCEQANR